ncbi:MAG: M50 family peptidase [Acidimicrobiales bacterium]|nr:M50 family metallopeptidase [Hyphomonadaceae bacterium]RZV41888.1 MAG: M50 family peptidase [Acidimicrobiales bacterium]
MKVIARTIISNHKPMRPLFFWGLVLAVWAGTQVQYVGLPFAFLSTWAHELGHGMGAVITGGHFDHMIITREFSGLAHTAVFGDAERIVVILGGLLGPAIAGGLLLIASRGLNLNRIALYILSALLFATALFWAGDNFTRIGTLMLGGFTLIIAVKGSPVICRALALIVAISLCLSAVTRLDYFFVKNGDINGRSHTSDTGALANIIGGGHLLWAILLSALSLFILYVSYRLSNGKSSRT